MATRSTREKKMMAMLMLTLALFGYYHLRVTGGIGAELVNKLLAGSVTDETIGVDGFIYPYQERKSDMEELIESIRAHVEEDSQKIAAPENNRPELAVSLSERQQALTDSKSALEFQKNLTTQLLSNLIPKSDTMEESTAMRSQIAQLAAALKLDILETTPVRNIEEIGMVPSSPLTDQIGNPVRYTDGAPVITYEQAQQIHQLPEVQLYQYKLSGNAVSFFVFLESINDLPWSLYVVSMDVAIPESATPDNLTPKMQVVLAF